MATQNQNKTQKPSFEKSQVRPQDPEQPLHYVRRNLVFSILLM